MSCCRMMVKGPKRACSKAGRVSGFAATAKRMSAEMLSKMYWSKFGLLGFFEMMPRTTTRRFRVFSKMGSREVRAVIMTLITPSEIIRKAIYPS